ncbi:hypothetical protein [Dyadobacter sp. CY323]|uniref:hypothetical protein n=1 Tax=Dyadobacter sp. CY323 TaxID=2907302 RepID=UPI001F3D88E4|nr:hypothetical protein [Dyadobacter sp. CY323]MCE6992039.1 hypothetical protein [Dyadobacter sp. CY323]
MRRLFLSLIILACSIQNRTSQYFDKGKLDKITLSMLLNHRSGIHKFTSGPDYLTWNTQPKNETEMVSII